jgi:hypothetical protein
MPASISDGSPVTFITLKGQVQPPGLMTEDISRPGVNGSAFRELQVSGEPFEMRGLRDCLNAADAKAKFALLKAMQGKTVTVVDDYGQSWTDVMLLSVEKAEQNALVLAAGGVQASATALLAVRFVMQVATVPA